MLLFLLSLKVQVAMQFTAETSGYRVLEMQNFTPAYMKGWRTYGRTDDRLITKISWMHR